MKITDYRKGTNQHATKIKYRKVIIALFVIIVGVGLYQWYIAPKSSKITPQSVSMAKEDITPEQREMLKKQAILAEREVIAKNKKEKLDATYKSESATIEAELETIRAEKMSFK